MKIQIKRTIAILLAVCFLVSLTIAAVSASPNFVDRDKQIKEERGKNGYDKNGHDKDGRDKDGYERDGHDKDGYNRDGYDKDGYNRDGYDKDGYNRDGYDKDGYNRDGCDKDGHKRVFEQKRFEKGHLEFKKVRNDGFRNQKKYSWYTVQKIWIPGYWIVIR